MPEPTEIHQRLTTFIEACEWAKAAAAILGEETAVRREANTWIVLISPGSAYRLRQQDPEYKVESIADDWSADPLTEDLLSDQDDWARSDEEGWFYED